MSAARTLQRGGAEIGGEEALGLQLTTNGDERQLFDVRELGGGPWTAATRLQPLEASSARFVLRVDDQLRLGIELGLDRRQCELCPRVRSALGSGEKRRD